jgi:hypothetical protein
VDFNSYHNRLASYPNDLSLKLYVTTEIQIFQISLSARNLHQYRVLRKYNLPLNNYHCYGLQFNIKNNYSQLFLFILLAGNVATNPGPSKPVKCVSLNARSLKGLHNTDNNNLKVLYLNARSIKSFITIGNNPSNKVCKITLLQELVHTGDYEVICICETWLNKTVLDSELLPGFNTFRRDREMGRSEVVC